MTVTFNYKVSGKGPFPIDMLRFDRAWPVHSDDANAIEYTMRPGLLTREERRNVPARNIHLCSVCRPINRRWESFGWRIVGDIEEQS